MGCKQEDITPAYLEITLEDIQNSMDVSTYNQEHETTWSSEQLAVLASQSFKEVWVSVNGDDRGVYKLPCRIPLLASDSSRIQIDPAIQLDGRSEVLPKYPFVNSFTKNVFLVKGETANFQSSPIKFKYIEDGARLKTPILETFEQSSSFTQLVENQGAKFVPNYRIDGRSVGKITLADTILKFNLISAGRDMPICEYAFVEIDYRCDDEFTVGAAVKNLYGQIEYIPLVNVRRSGENGDEWRKIYVNLTQVINQKLDVTNIARDFKIYLSGESSEKDKTINIYMDNIKLIYLQRYPTI